MHSLQSFAELARIFEARARDKERMRVTLDRIADVIQEKAKSNLGHYHRATGPIAGWARLAESTIRDRVRLGYPPNAPLLRSEALRDSIEKSIEVFSATHGIARVGSNLIYARRQELGYGSTPPRPFLSLALWQKREQILRIAGDMTVIATGSSGSDYSGEMYQAHAARAMVRAAAEAAE